MWSGGLLTVNILTSRFYLMNNMADTLPTCVGFIMDGNRRWAKEHGQPTVVGHQAGESKFYEVAQWIKECKIPHAVFYAFSIENWLREKMEVSYLQELFLSFTIRMLAEVHDWKCKIVVIGDLTSFTTELQSKIVELENVSEVYTGNTIWVALSYGGRAEILDAVQKAIAAGVAVNETTFRNLMWSAGMPDPDLIIRTGGNERLSNFLPWQSVYSELMFTPTYWPAFTKAEFTRMLAQYADRQRRYGA
jgi:undecaprenyl diphosphate synthase